MSSLSKTSISKRLLLQHNRCFYCGEILQPGKMEIDHILPMSIYNDNTVKNLCICCVSCNRIKANHSLELFYDIVLAKYPEKLIRGMFYYQFLNIYHG